MKDIRKCMVSLQTTPPYTHIIDATDITAEQVLAEALTILGDE